MQLQWRVLCEVSIRGNFPPNEFQVKSIFSHHDHHKQIATHTQDALILSRCFQHSQHSRRESEHLPCEAKHTRLTLSKCASVPTAGILCFL